jgi:hypothetical protein
MMFFQKSAGGGVGGWAGGGGGAGLGGFDVLLPLFSSVTYDSPYQLMWVAMIVS